MNYISTVMQIPMLADGQQYTKQQLIDSHLRLVVSIVSRYYRREREEDLFDDMIQEGNLALIKAAGSYDASKGIPFAAYAIPHIRYAIMDVRISNISMINIVTTKAHRKVYFNIGKYKAGSDLTTEQIKQMSDDLCLSEQQVAEAAGRFNIGYVSIDCSDQDGQQFDSRYAIDTRYQPDLMIEQYQYDQFVGNVATSVDVLNQREADIVIGRWLADCPLTLRELGQKYSVSTTRIQQIETVALGKMKNKLIGQYYDYVER